METYTMWACWRARKEPRIFIAVTVECVLNDFSKPVFAHSAKTAFTKPKANAFMRIPRKKFEADLRLHFAGQLSSQDQSVKVQPMLGL
jgi:hypothetical protein